MSLDKIITSIKVFIKDLFIIFMDAISFVFKAIESLFAKNEMSKKLKNLSSEVNQNLQKVSEKLESDENTQEAGSSRKSINISKLGEFLDGWADLVEGMGEKAAQVRSKTLEALELKNMPDNYLGLTPAFDANHMKERDYILSNTNPGATTAIYIAEHGQDLYVSWKTWLKPVLNVGLFILIGIISFIGGYATFGTHEVGGSLFTYGYTETWVAGWAGSTAAYFILALILISFLAKTLKGDPYAFFFIEPSVFDAEDISAMSLTVHKTMLRVLDQEGIDISKLRIKEKFTGGRKGEDI